MTGPVMFNQVLDLAGNILRSSGTKLGNDVVLVRDLFGRIRVLLRGDRSKFDDVAMSEAASRLHRALGAYALPEKDLLLFTEDLMEGESYFESGDRRLIIEQDDLRIWLLDRQLMGQDWTRAPLGRTTSNRRVTFFGIKGGVGRSTVISIWAWHLARKGKNVLVADLDLESPGISSTLLPPDAMPDYGILDWFVEDAVGQAKTVEKNMVADSPLAKDTTGRIRVIPAFGRDTGDFLPKLARCYLDSTGSKVITWAERLQRMIESLERHEKPDILLIDSRAGLHDIAAITVTRMNADAFLFAVDSLQTWAAYSFLFRHWKRHPELQEFRPHMQMVAGMVPETDRENYLRRFRERSWDLFRENIYDSVMPEDIDAYSFDLDSEEAPHNPLPVFWSRALQEFDPGRIPMGIDEQTARAALGKFMEEADKMVFRDEDEG